MAKGICSFSFGKVDKVVNHLQQDIQALAGILPNKTSKEYIILCHQALLNLYPGLKLRWSQIYGPRWSHVYGNIEGVSCDSFRVQLNAKYGVNIEDAGYFAPQELHGIINTLKRCFSDGIKI